MKIVDESENQRQIRLAIAKGTTVAARETETATRGNPVIIIQHRFTTAKTRGSESVEQKQARLKRRSTA